MTRVSKRPGWDWPTFNRWDDEPGIHAMTVFGAMSPEQALDGPRSSLGENYEILGMSRQDLPVRFPRMLRLTYDTVGS